jgi:transmembrane 9 superfamily member 2/4
MNVNETCTVICKKKVDPKTAKFINKRIRERYQIHMLIDNLPTARKLESKNKDIHMYATAFELGRILVSS